jgi:Excalibur calcium-binding domain
MVARRKQTPVHNVCDHLVVSVDTLLGSRQPKHAKTDRMDEGYPKFRQAQRHGGPYRPGRGARRARQRESFAVQVISGCTLVGIASWTLAPQLISQWRTSSTSPAEVEAVERSIYYQGCDEARAAGVAPIYRGSPGYREGMDGDDDGIACEPYRGM